MRTFPFRSSRASDLLTIAPPRARSVFTWLLVVLAGLAVIGAIIWTALALRPPGIDSNLATPQTDVPLDTTVRLVPLGWAGSIQQATLFETRLDEPGAVERPMPVAIETIRSSWLPGQSEALVQLAGALRPDAHYRLVVSAEGLAATLPLPTIQTVAREIELTTPPAPRPVPATAPIEVRWNEPLVISWKQPIESFAVEVTPAAPVRTWVDPANPERSYVLIDQPADGATYEIQIVDALGQNGMRLQQPVSYQIAAPVRPQPLVQEPLPAMVGQPVPIRWNVPIDKLDIQTPPELSATWQADDRDPSLVHLWLDGLAQGATYELSVLNAVAKSGAPLAAPSPILVTTPPPYAAPTFEVDRRGGYVPVDAQPVIRFASPVLDQAAAVAAISIDPPVAGHFEWLDAQSVRFVPDEALPYESDLTITVQSGPNGPRASDGAFLEEEAQFAFTTMTNKLIDVDLSRQTMRLYEGDRVVHTILVATGVSAAPTPTGEYYVQYKMPIARFRGVNPSGSTYDIPNVRWVLPFLGDYTIHGAYWRSNFGTPGSAGCISMSDADAKIVYDWAPVGTPIQIHY